MPVDYSKFKDIEDSDEEPIWETQGGKKYKGVPAKVLNELEQGATKIKSKKCYCFLDFASDPTKLQIYAEEIQKEGIPVPTKKQLGRVVIELDQAIHAPRLCENFRRLCTGEQGEGVGKLKLHYKARPLDVILPKYCVQVSIPNEYSCWGRYLDDEKLRIPGVSFDRPGLVAVGNHGPNTNSCTFMITLNEADHLDGYNQIIGRVVKGMEVLRVIEMLPTDRKERSYNEKNVKSWWGGRPVVDVYVENCGELSPDQVDMSMPEDGDIYAEHPIDVTCQNDYEILMQAAEKIKEIGNDFYKAREYPKALGKYRKALKYLAPLLREQHHDAFGEEDPTTWMAGGYRPKDRSQAVRLDFTIKLNVCQTLYATQEFKAAIAMADNVLLELIGKHSKKGNGALPNDPLTIKALFRRAKARVALSDSKEEISQLDEAIEDLQKALYVDPNNQEVQLELEKIKVRQKKVDMQGQQVYQNMLSGGMAEE